MVLARPSDTVSDFRHILVDSPSPLIGILMVLIGAVMHRVKSGIHRRPDRNAHRNRSIIMCEPYPLRRKTVDIGRTDISSSITAQFGRKQIIGNDDNNIRAPVIPVLRLPGLRFGSTRGKRIKCRRRNGGDTCYGVAFF